MNIRLQNLGTVNKNVVCLDSERDYIKLWFSYETPVSVNARINGEYFDFTRQNDWSTTTGKLLNELEPNKDKRISGEEFENKLRKILADYK